MIAVYMRNIQLISIRCFYSPTSKIIEASWKLSTQRVNYGEFRLYDQNNIL